MIQSKTTKMMCVPFTIVCNRFTNAGNAHLRCRDKHSHTSHVSSVWVWHHYDHMMIHRVFLLLHPSATLLLVKASQTAPDGLWWLDQTAVKTDTGRNQLALIQVSVPGFEKKLLTDFCRVFGSERALLSWFQGLAHHNAVKVWRNCPFKTVVG